MGIPLTNVIADIQQYRSLYSLTYLFDHTMKWISLCFTGRMGYDGK